MDLPLKSKFEVAYSFLDKLEKNESELASTRHLLMSSQARMNYTLRQYRQSVTRSTTPDTSLQWYHLIFWQFFLLIALLSGLKEVLFAKSIEKKEVKKDLKYKEAYEKFLKEEKVNFDKINAELNALLIQKNKLENEKSCLNFISYAPYRTKHAIKYMYQCVISGRASTIEQATDCYQNYWIAKDRADLLNEQREEANRQHRETLDALEKIARHQENINDNLEHIRRYG